MDSPGDGGTSRCRLGRFDEIFRRLLPPGLDCGVDRASRPFRLLLGRALQVLPVGVAYAVWTGIGAVGTVLLGVILFGDTPGPFRIGGVAFVFAGIVMLKFAPA